MPILPPALRPGDLVAVVAPSGPVPRDDFWRGLAWVRDRYRVRMSIGVFARGGYLAGDDGRRAQELSAAFRDPEVKAVLAARGGYGASRLIDRLGGLDTPSLLRAPRWLVGFSDLTALHVLVSAAGVASIHGPNVTGLGRTAPSNRGAWLAALESPGAVASWEGLTVLHEGPRSSGTVCGGNLALVEAMAAAGRLTVPKEGVLMLEDVDERPYRVDRMLTSLRLGGHLARASAIVFGAFTRCAPGPDGTTVSEVLHERTAGLGIPVLAGAPFGHGEHNRAFVLGRLAEVGAGRVDFPAV